MSELGRLSWATPHVHELIEEVSQGDYSAWATLAPLIEKWLLTETSLDLKIDCFSAPMSIAYERRQQKMHLLRIVQNKVQKTAEDLKNKLPITKRESEVLYWVSYGKTSWEISQILAMSPRTVNKHLEQVYKKLGVDNRTSAAAISIRILEG